MERVEENDYHDGASSDSDDSVVEAGAGLNREVRARFLNLREHFNPLVHRPPRYFRKHYRSVYIHSYTYIGFFT